MYPNTPKNKFGDDNFSDKFLKSVPRVFTTVQIHVFIQISGKSSARKYVKRCFVLLTKSSQNELFRRHFAPVRQRAPKVYRGVPRDSCLPVKCRPNPFRYARTVILDEYNIWLRHVMIFSLSFVTFKLAKVIAFLHLLQAWRALMTSISRSRQSFTHSAVSASLKASSDRQRQLADTESQRHDDRYKLCRRVWATLLRKTELDREGKRFGPTSRAVQLMKSTETKLTAYGRWRCRTSVDNDVILTSVVIVRVARPAWPTGRLAWQSSSFCDDDRHNAICRGYGAGTMTVRAIIGDELYRSPVGSHCGSTSSFRTSSLPPAAAAAAAGTDFFLQHHRHVHHGRLLLTATRRSGGDVSSFECTKACTASTTALLSTDRSKKQLRYMIITT